MTDTDVLLAVLTDIRMKTGLGDKPMLSELAEALVQKLEVPAEVIKIVRDKERYLLNEALDKAQAASQEEDSPEMSFWSTKANRHSHAFSIINAIDAGIKIGRIPK